MTSDQNSPVIEHTAQGAPSQSSQQESLFGGSNPPHGMGQSKSSRRRRRKRKSKGENEGGEHASNHSSEQSAVSQNIGSLQASAQPSESNFRPAPSNGQQFQNNNGAASGGKRWKKKFRDRDRQRAGGSFENPGQSNDQGQNIQASGSSNFRPANNGGSRSNGGIKK